MGVTKLWLLLSTASEKDVELSSLCGLTIAVDLSQWICELRRVPAAQNISNLYLRNLYFRTTNLMKHGIKLVFVEDGTAPGVKQLEMNRRNRRNDSSLDRLGMKAISEKCRELLQLLGLPCIQADGEAEKLCAKLNSAGVVDGVMSEDGDSFLYGAKKVYRNKENDTVECCNIEEIERKLNLNQGSMVAMALLSGCDYDKEGVQNIGIKKAKDFIEMCNKMEVDPLTRMKNWRKNKDLISLQEKKDSPQKKQTHCSVCKHLGSKPEHFKNGCDPCSAKQSCDSESQVTCSCDSCIIEQNKFELKLREKALQDKDFPNPEIIDEFLNNDDSVPKITFRPINVPGLKHYLKSHLNWNDIEFFNKISDLLVNLQMIGMSSAVKDPLKPNRIVRSTRHETPSLAVEWKKLDIDNVTTGFQEVIVPVENFKKLYPDMVTDFENKKEEEKQQKIQERKEKAKQSRKRKQEESKNQGTLTGFFKVVKKAKEASPEPSTSQAKSEDCITLE